MIAIIQNHKHKVLSIGGTDDHVHIFIGYHQTQLIPNLITHLKRDTTIWIKDNKFVKCRFSWQEGYGAFSYGKSQINDVIKYINNQEEHHKKHTFKDEYKAFLDKYGIEYDERYIFQ